MRRFVKKQQRKDSGMAQDVAPLIRGEFQLDVHEKLPDGSVKIVQRIREHNLIVEKAPYIMARALGDISNPDWVIGGVQWGTGGHVAGDPSTPVPPSSTDTALETYVLETSLSSTTPGDTYVQFEVEMGSATGNGNVFTEAGLVVNAVTKEMFARKTFPGITKTSDRTITLRWIISFLQNTSGSDCQGVGLFGQLSIIPQYQFTVPAAPTSYTEITVPLTWTPGLNRLWVWRNGKRVFTGDAYTESHPAGIIAIDPVLIPGEIWTFEVID